MNTFGESLLELVKHEPVIENEFTGYSDGFKGEMSAKFIFGAIKY